jgi:16S rRNA processing protein RimM
MSPEDERLVVGRVARAHGNRGEVIVNLETDFADERFRTGATLLVGPEDAAQPRRIRQVRFHQGRPVIALEGVESMNDAEALAGAELRMRLADMAPLPAGTYRHHDLIGCDVFDRQDRRIGRVTAIEGPMDRSQLVVAGARGEVLIPLVAEICISVDPAAQRIVIDPPQGLLELNAAADKRG